MSSVSRVVVAGPRVVPEVAAAAALAPVLRRLAAWRPGVVVVEGGAAGPDTAAGLVAASAGLPVEVFPARWSACSCGRDCVARGASFCRAAGVARSRLMLGLPGVAGLLVVVCPACGLRGSGRCCAGTRATVALARSFGLPVWPVFVGGRGPVAGASAPVTRDRKQAPRTPQPSESMADALESTGMSLEADQILRERWDDGLHGAVDRLVYDPITGEDRFVRGEDGTPVFSDQLYEDVELCEADYSVKQLDWRRLPHWELRLETRSEDTQLLDAAFTGSASSTRGRDLGAKNDERSITAWHFAVERNLERDARLEALALRQLEYSARKAFGMPLTLTRPALGAEPGQVRGHVRVGAPAA